MIMYSTGETIYKYKLINRIGGGSFGEVWWAEDMSIHTTCAIKMLPQTNVTVNERLLEAKIGHCLVHPNVVNIKYADIVYYGTPPIPLVIIVMPFYSKGAVTTLANGANFIDSDIALRCIIDVLRGLEYLHENGYFHCDIKPQNILVGDKSEYILSDYGITCSTVNCEAVKPRSSYLPHLAPETKSENVYDARTDIYQLGVTAFRLFNGISTIVDEFQKNEASFINNVIKGNIITNSKFQPFIPSVIRKVIKKATAHDPSERYQTPLEMRRSLERIRLNGKITANEKGEIVIITQGNEYTYKITSMKNHMLTFDVFRKNMQSERIVHVSKYAQKNLNESDVRIAITNLVSELL